MSKMKDMLMKILLLSTFYLGGCHANVCCVQFDYKTGSSVDTYPQEQVYLMKTSDITSKSTIPELSHGSRSISNRNFISNLPIHNIRLVVNGLVFQTGVPVQYAMGVIYAVPAAMGLTIFVSLIVIMGMMCTRTEEAQQQHLTMESAAAVAMGVATDFDTDGGYAQISEVDGGGESLRL